MRAANPAALRDTVMQLAAGDVTVTKITISKRETRHDTVLKNLVGRVSILRLEGCWRCGELYGASRRFTENDRGMHDDIRSRCGLTAGH